MDAPRKLVQFRPSWRGENAIELRSPTQGLLAQRPSAARGNERCGHNAPTSAPRRPTAPRRPRPGPQGPETGVPAADAPRVRILRAGHRRRPILPAMRVRVPDDLVDKNLQPSDTRAVQAELLSRGLSRRRR